nr:hypothetical protein [Tanacetum cinerariifolium]
QTPSSGISILLAVGTPSTGSGNLYCQWELSPGSGNALCILFPTRCNHLMRFCRGCSKCYCPIAKTFISAAICTSAIGSSSYKGLISVSSSCASFPDLLLVSCYFEFVPLLSVSTKLASNALLVSTFSFIVFICISFTQLSYSLLCYALSSMDFLTYSICWISVSWNSGIAS